MGVCNGLRSLCAIGGYALDSRYAILRSSAVFHSNFFYSIPRCHLGQSIVYDTVTELNWDVNLRTHPIQIFIEKVLQKEWEPAKSLERQVPVPVDEDEDCAVRSLAFVLAR